MAAHSYWRLLFLKGSNASYVTIGQVIFRDQHNGPQLATGGTVLYSSQRTGYEATRAFDGDFLTTSWESAASTVTNGNTFIGYQFTSPVEINEVVLVGNSYETDERPVSGVLQYSDDGSTWHNDFDFQLNPTTSQTPQVLKITRQRSSVGPYYYDEQFPSHTKTAAWGLRRLISTYTGPLVRIRDSADNSEQDVGQDAEGYLAAFTVAGNAHVVRVYDQTGGDDLVQPTASLQPRLILNITPGGGPAIKADGVDDYLYGATLGTTRPYMTTRPIMAFVGGGGPDGIREAFATIAKIAHVGGANTSPFGRFGLNFGESGTTDSINIEARIDGTGYTTNPFSSFSSNRGWGACGIGSSFGRVLHGAYRGIQKNNDNAVTYPNSTSMYVFSNGLGTENWGGYMSELVMMDQGSADWLVQADLRADFPKILASSTHRGENLIFRLRGHGSHGSASDYSFGFAELQAFAGASPTNYASRSFVSASSNFSAVEHEARTVDGITNNVFSASTEYHYPHLIFAANDKPSAPIDKVMIKARTSNFFNQVPRTLVIERLRPDWSWEVVYTKNTFSEGNVSAQEYNFTWTPPGDTIWKKSLDYKLFPLISNGWAGFIYRQRIAAKYFAGLEQARIGFFAPTANSLAVDSVFFAPKGTGAIEFASTPVEITFNGSSGFDILPGEIAWSDPFTVPPGVDLVFGIDFTSDTAKDDILVLQTLNVILTDFDHGYKSGTSADFTTGTPSGYSTSSLSRLIIPMIEGTASAAPIESDIFFSWDLLESDFVEASVSFTWDLIAPDDVIGDFTSTWNIPLAANRRFTWDLSNLTDSFDHQFHVKGAVIPGKVYPVMGSKTGRTVTDAEFPSAEGPLVEVNPPVSSDIATVVGSYHFYGDYYERIWIDPILRRIPNPRINVPYSFDVWNAFSRTNELDDVTNINLVGVELDWTSGLQWGRYELKSLEYTITPSAPSSVDGSFFLEFLYGEGSTRVVAVVIDVLQTQPNEPMTEVWQWNTSVTSSYAQVEQRAALRDQPRVMVRYTANLADDEERLRAYRQFYSFINRSVLIPMFQYTTPLEELAAAGSFALKFDLSIADVRQGEYLVLFNKSSMAYELYRALTVETDGITVENPLAFDRSEEWEVIPTRSMRLPDATALAMGAVNGDLTVAGESLTFRALERPASATSHPTYDGELIIPDRPVAVDNLPEAFKAGVEVIDNSTSNPTLATAWPAPMVQINRFYQIDRDTDMDYWKAIFAEIRGRHKSFLLPTWRDDLPLAEQPSLGDSFLITTNIDVVDYFDSEAYRYVQIDTEAGVIYRRINSVELEGDTVLITLNAGLGTDPGSNVVRRVSYVYRVRLDSDEVVLQHYRNWSIIELQLRTVNE